MSGNTIELPLLIICAVKSTVDMSVVVIVMFPYSTLFVPDLMHAITNGAFSKVFLNEIFIFVISFGRHLIPAVTPYVSFFWVLLLSSESLL